MNNDNRLQILKENFKQNEGSETFKEWVELNADNDPNFFNWFFGDTDNINDFGMGMTEEQKEEYNNFMQKLN